MNKRTLLAAAAACAFAAPAAGQDFTITNATVATGDGSEPIENGHVVVRGGKVVAVGAGAPPAGGKRKPPRLWAGPRRAPEAAASVRAAQAALRGG